MKSKALSVVPLVIGVIFSVSVPSPSSSLTIPNSVKRTHAAHPIITGFNYSYGYLSPQLSINAFGYYYYDMDVYYRQASSVSRYYIVHVGVEFTCGSLASQNPPENYSFDKHYDLYTGYINIRPYQYSSGSKKSSDITFKAAWPATSTFTSTVSSSFGASISGNSDLTAGTDLMGGVKIESTNSRGFTLSFSNTTSIHGPEPAIYLNTAVDPLNQKQWSYVYAGLGKSLLLDTYYMFEVKNNGSGYQDYSFKFDVEINMKNVAWKSYPWQQLKDLNASYNEEYGMY